jgi:hypothetical protein
MGKLLEALKSLRQVRQEIFDVHPEEDYDRGRQQGWDDVFQDIEQRLPHLLEQHDDQLAVLEERILGRLAEMSEGPWNGDGKDAAVCEGRNDALKSVLVDIATLKNRGRSVEKDAQEPVARREDQPIAHPSAH